MSVFTTPVELRQNVNALFVQEMLKQRTPFTSSIATVVSSKTAKEIFPWIGDAPQLVDFTDEIEFKPMTKTTYEVESGEFAVACAIKRTEVEDDVYGAITKRISQMARKAAVYSEKLVVSALEANGNGYDGVALFSANHPARNLEGGDQSNLVSYSGNTTAQVQTDINAAIAKLGKFKDESGEPYCEGFQKLFVLAPWDLRKPIREALGAVQIDGTTNVVFNDMAVDLIFSGRLSSATNYFIGVQDVETKGLVFVDRLAPTFSALEEGSANAFTLSQYWYQTRMRGKAAPGKWQAIIKVA